jgi:hypothetical protein
MVSGNLVVRNSWDGVQSPECQSGGDHGIVIIYCSHAIAFRFTKGDNKHVT